LCDIGYYGSSCSYSCETCVGKLCDKNGNCRFELKRKFELKDTPPGSLIIDYNATFYTNYSNLKLMYWISQPSVDVVSFLYSEDLLRMWQIGMSVCFCHYRLTKNNKFEYQEVSLYNGNKKALPVNYNSFYVACVLLYQNLYLANVKCQTSFVCSRCIENLSNVKIYKKNVVWKMKDRSDLLPYGLHYSFRNGSCGQPSNNFFIRHSNLPIIANPPLKGIWEICVVCEEEEEGLKNFCKEKKSCRIHNFGQGIHLYIY
ncbi:hypothetical protein Anas_06256, partial [Armadillidium nasatum]